MISRNELALIMNDCLISDDPLEALINRVDEQLQALLDVGSRIDVSISAATNLEVKYKDLLPLIKHLEEAKRSLKRVIYIEDWQICDCCEKPHHKSQYAKWPTDRCCLTCETEAERDIEDGIDEVAS